MILLILNNEIYSEDKRDRLQEIAVQTITKRNIKQIELDKNNFFKFNKEDLEIELINFATNLNTDLDTLKNIFVSNELDFSIIENQVREKTRKVHGLNEIHALVFSDKQM